MFNRKLKAELAATKRLLKVSAKRTVALNRENRVLKDKVEALSIQKEPRHSVGAIDYIVYDSKVLSKIGNAFLSATDDPAFKLGIQFALRHFEKELVVGR